MLPSKVLIALSAAFLVCEAGRPPPCNNWSPGWGSCSTHCGGGVMYYYEYNCHNQHVATHTSGCNSHIPCPVNCQVSGYGAWGGCSASCNGGQQSRNRHVTVSPNYGGSQCPVMSESRTCNPHTCPVDCAVGEWQAWKSCDASCGGGTSERVRAIIQHNVGGGGACPTLAEHKPCNEQACPVDCKVSEWQAGECDVKCGGGELTSTRSVEIAAAHGGVSCPELTKSQPCNEHPCPVDCTLYPLSPWSVCTKACEGGTKTAVMAISGQPEHGGAACPSEELRTFKTECNTGPCPIDCVLAETFGEWSNCTHTCGGGIRERVKEVVSEANEVGKCHNEGETEACSTQACPVDCAITDMPTEFGPCSEPCGGGKQARHRIIVTEAAHGGEACPTEGLSEEQDCNTQECIETFTQEELDAAIAKEQTSAANALDAHAQEAAVKAKDAAAELAIMKAYQLGANKRYAKLGFEPVTGPTLDTAIEEQNEVSLVHSWDNETLAKIAEAEAAGHAAATEGTRIPLRAFTGNCDDYCYCRVYIDGERSVNMLPKSELNGEGCTTFSAGIKTADGKNAEAKFECYANEDKEKGENLACDMMKEGNKKATDKFKFVWGQVTKKLAAKKSKKDKKFVKRLFA